MLDENGEEIEEANQDDEYDDLFADNSADNEDYED